MESVRQAASAVGSSGALTGRMRSFGLVCTAVLVITGAQSSLLGQCGAGTCGGGTGDDGGAGESGGHSIAGLGGDPSSEVLGAAGHCGGECEDSCPPGGPGGGFIGDPVLVPDMRYLHVETDLKIVDRGMPFVIRRVQLGARTIDPQTYMFGCQGKNSIFGPAWNSTLQMYSYWGRRCQETYYSGSSLFQRVNLGGYYLHELACDPNCAADPGRLTDPNWYIERGKSGCFKGPGTSDWLRFASYTNNYNNGSSQNDQNVCLNAWWPNPGVLITREGMKYFFDYSCMWDANQIDANDRTSLSAAMSNGYAQLLSRMENRYGQAYDFEYVQSGTCLGWGETAAQYLLSRVRTPSGRQIVLRYDPNEPNHVSSIDLTDASGNVVASNMVRYGYYPQNYVDPNCAGQLRYVRRGCDCSGGSNQERWYTYRKHSSYNCACYQIIKITDGQGRVILENVDSNGDGAVNRQVVGNDPNMTWTYNQSVSGLSVLTTATAPDSSSMTYSYNWYYQRFAKMERFDLDPNNRISWSGYTFNDWRGMTGVKRPDDANEVYTYDACGRRTQRRVYDACTAEWYESERLEHTDFAGFSQISRRYEPNDPNIYWSYTYDSHGNLTSMTGPQVTKGLAEGLESYRSVDSYTYLTSSDANDANFPGNWGLMGTHTDPNGMVTKFEYNGQGYMTRKIVDYGGQNLVHQYSVDALGRTLQYTDPNGAVTDYEYQARMALP